MMVSCHEIIVSSLGMIVSWHETKTNNSQTTNLNYILQKPRYDILWKLCSAQWMAICVAVFIWVAMPGQSVAQKALKQVRIYLQQNKTSDALKEINKLSADPKTNTLPRLYDYAVEANIMLYNSYNEKMYLKQVSDTAAFFQATYAIFQNALKCDSLEQAKSETASKTSFRKKNALLIQQYYGNLLLGSKYFFQHKQNAQAAKFALMGFRVPQTELWGTDKSITATQPYHNNAAYGVLSLYNEKQYGQVDSLSLSALSDTTQLRLPVLHTLVLNAQAQNDTAAMLRYLQMGLEDYPSHIFFFDKLSLYYNSHADYESMHLLASTMLAKDSLNSHFLAIETYSQLCLDNNDAAIESGKRLIKADSTLSVAQYYVGVAYYNKAQKISLPTNINNRRYRVMRNEKQSYYRAARPYIEAYREKVPSDKATWAPKLYTIYLELNEGKKFEEMEQILHSLP